MRNLVERVGGRVSPRILLGAGGHVALGTRRCLTVPGRGLQVPTLHPRAPGHLGSSRKSQRPWGVGGWGGDPHREGTWTQQGHRLLLSSPVPSPPHTSPGKRLTWSPQHSTPRRLPAGVPAAVRPPSHPGPPVLILGSPCWGGRPGGWGLASRDSSMGGTGRPPPG